MMNRIILAGMFSCSNMGQKVDSQHLQMALKCPPKTYQDSVDLFCGRYMETNQHEKIFYAEGKSWHSSLSKLSDRAIKETHPELAAMYEAAEKELKT